MKQECVEGQPALAEAGEPAQEFRVAAAVHRDHRHLHVRHGVQPFIAISGLTGQLAQLVARLQLGKYGLLAAIVAFYVVIGMFMNALPALVLTVPFFFPLAVNAGLDPILFGVIVVILVELGVVTPPIGVNVFAISAMTKDATMYQIFRGVFPFWFAFLLLVALIAIFPQIALFLPSLM